ncbi:UxaA family hydrolase [Pusillimonas sp. MFBS29]|uniref:UxaA family hydrolase n=1 Tax=Pusillimonas sp. MFBS29 TaxID=2886690 RepID=UPI001D128E63|nr:UxaA family hydrolase [Pusillimonas sp. MFBS29]MCC2596756.1 UxaA family hydrolase [Pusillimonas sp. MFBS29]
MNSIDKAAIQIRDVDHVATAIHELLPGELVKIRGALEEYEVPVHELIPTGHKIALRDIALNEEIIKYGEVIGSATSAIGAGHLVHVHNCRGLKARRFSGPSQTGGKQDG